VNRFLKNVCGIQADWQERTVLAITAAISVALSTGVIGALLYLLIALGALISSPVTYAQAAPPVAGVQLQAGIEKENVDGDLNAAISIYQKIAADSSAPREVRAKALLRLAGCEEKLGKQAKQVYEQIVRDYADQPAAAQARTRLTAIRQQEHPAPPPTMTARKIDWAKLGSMGAGDTDGERATFIGSDGNLYFGDIAGHNRRLVFKTEPNSPDPGWCATQDFSMVALALAATANHPQLLAVVKMDGTGYREPIRDDQGRIFGSNLVRVDLSWSWDNRYLAVTTRPRGEGSRLIVVDASNGSHRELARSDSDWLSGVGFSPDGRFIAYEATPAKPNHGTNRVYVIPVRGGEPHLVKEVPELDTGGSHVLKDWTADGRYLITIETRQGKSALHLLPIKDGVPTGPSEFVRFGDFEDAHTTASGALVYRDRAATATDVDAYLASFDSIGHIGGWRSLDLWAGNGKLKTPWPSFSPDGSQIAYRAGDADPTKNDLILLDLSTGQQRVIYQSPNGDLFCQYSTKEPKIFCTLTGRDSGNRTDLFSVDDKTGIVEKIASVPGSKGIHHSPDDGRTFYFVDLADDTGNRNIRRWDLDTQQETVLVPGPQAPEIFENTSFEGRWLLRSVDGNSLSVRPVSGGDWKVLVSGVKGLWTNDETTHDGNWAFYQAYDSAGKPALFRVPTTGGTPELVGGLPSASFKGQHFFLSDDGNQILVTKVNDEKHDLWVLENFEPPPLKK
jgi:Tol biopolymer transport system component